MKEEVIGVNQKRIPSGDWSRRPAIFGIPIEDVKKWAKFHGLEVKDASEISGLQGIEPKEIIMDEKVSVGISESPLSSVRIEKACTVEVREWIDNRLALHNEQVTQRVANLLTRRK